LRCIDSAAGACPVVWRGRVAIFGFVAPVILILAQEVSEVVRVVRIRIPSLVVCCCLAKQVFLIVFVLCVVLEFLGIYLGVLRRDVLAVLGGEIERVSAGKRLKRGLLVRSIEDEDIRLLELRLLPCEGEDILVA
jgi:hypothetical protein